MCSHGWTRHVQHMGSIRLYQRASFTLRPGVTHYLPGHVDPCPIVIFKQFKVICVHMATAAQKIMVAQDRAIRGVKWFPPACQRHFPSPMYLEVRYLPAGHRPYLVRIIEEQKQTCRTKKVPVRVAASRGSGWSRWSLQRKIPRLQRRTCHST